MSDCTQRTRSLAGSIFEEPRPQGKHASEPFPVVPAPHWHASMTVLPRNDVAYCGHELHVFRVRADGAEYVPAGQSSHGSALTVLLYFPAWHRWPMKCFHQTGLQCIHMSNRRARLATTYSWHDVQTLSFVACSAVEYFPLPQLVHSLLPYVGLYLPASQAVQFPAFPK